MRTKRYFTIYFNDLSNEKQMEILESLKNELKDITTKEEVLELVGSDPFDIDRPNVDAFEDVLLRVDEQAERSWCEMEFVIDLTKKGFK